MARIVTRIGVLHLVALLAAILAILAASTSTAVLASVVSSCPENPTVEILSSRIGPGVFLVPRSVLPKDYCIFVNTSIARYTEYGDMVVVEAPLPNITVADVGCEHQQFVPFAILTGVYTTGVSDYDGGAPSGYIDAGRVSIVSTSVFMAMLQYVTPSNNTVGTTILVFPSPVSTSDTLSVYIVLRPVNLYPGDMIVFNLTYAGIILYGDGSAAVWVDATFTSITWSPSAQQEVT